MRGERFFRRVPTFVTAGRRLHAALVEPLRLRHPPVAVELAEDAVTVVHARREEARRTLAFARRNLEPGTLEVSMMDMRVPRPADLARHIERALESVGAADGEVSCFFPTAAARAVVVEADALPASPAERLDVLRWKAGGKLPYPAREARVAYEIYPSARGGKARALVVAVRESVVEAVEGVFSSLGVRVGFLQPSTLHAMATAPSAEPLLHVAASPRFLTLGISEGAEAKMLRVKDLAHASPGEFDRILLREALATARYFEEHGQSPAKIAACRLAWETRPAPLEGNGGPPVSALEDALGVSVSGCPWPEALLIEEEEALAPFEKVSLAPLAWAVTE